MKDTSTTEDLEKIAQQALEQLPPQRKLIFRLCKIEGHTYEEVAFGLGYPMVPCVIICLRPLKLFVSIFLLAVTKPEVIFHFKK